MYHRIIVVFVFAVVGVAFQHCTFQADNKYINPIAPPGSIAFTIQVNDPNFSDPFYIIEPTVFKFTLADLTQPIFDYEISIDGNIVAQGTDGNIQFFLFPHSLDPGTHTANMKIRIATKSGSLADKLGGEYYLVEKNFRIINDPSPPSAVTPTATYEDGKLTIRWNKRLQKNFYYVIKRTYSPYFPMRDTIIRNTAQDVFVDPGYVGGELKYEITATGFGFDRHSLGSVIFKDDPVDFKVTRTD